MEKLEQQIFESYTRSLWTLAASAVDRCFAILRPFKYNRLMNKTIARCMLGAVWLLSLGLALCPVIGIVT